MTIALRALLMAMMVGAAGPAAAQTSAPASSGVGEALEGEELRREVSGSTVAGFHLRNMMRFSEYHSPDGRIFGHNGGVPVDRGCWDVQANEVCYYYEGDELPRGTWCWTMRRLASANQYRLHHSPTDGIAFGVRQAGNPNNWSDNGKPWQCHGLISQRRTPNQSTIAQRRP